MVISYKLLHLFSIKISNNEKLILSAILGFTLISCGIQQNSTKMTDWKHTTNIYEVNVRQYTKEGTFKAFQKELPRLQKWG